MGSLCCRVLLVGSLALQAPFACTAVELPPMPTGESGQNLVDVVMPDSDRAAPAKMQASYLGTTSAAAPQNRDIDWRSNLFAKDSATGSGTPTSDAGILKSRIGFDLPGSRPGETPALAAHYASNHGGPGDELGSGWILAIPTLERHRDVDGNDTFYLRVGADYTVLLAESEGESIVLRPRGAPLSGAFRITTSGVTAQLADGNAWSFDASPESSYLSERANSVSYWRITGMSSWGRTYAQWTYKRDAGATYLDAISYQPDEAGSHAIVVKVGYESRLTPAEEYRDGAAIEYRLRASTITAAADGAVVREWRLTYAPVQTLVGIAAVSERLSRIDEAATHPSSGLRSERRIASFRYETSQEATQESWPAKVAPPQPFSALVADLNGDGRADVASAEAGLAAWNVWLSQGDGWDDIEPVQRPWRPGPPGRPRFILFGSTIHMPTPWAATSGDFDGDGRVDLLHGLSYETVGPGMWWMFRNTGTGWKTSPGFERWSNGPLSFYTVPFPPLYEYFSYMLRCRVGRFSLDKRDDVACYADWSKTPFWTVGYSKGDGWRTEVIGDYKGSLGPAPRAASHVDQKGAEWLKGCFVADFTGEGLDDMACRKTASSVDWEVGRTDGSKWWVSAWALAPGISVSTCFVASVNTDELADLACHGTKGEWYAIASTGAGWATPRKLAGPNVATAAGKCSAVDLDADRVSEVVCVDTDLKTFQYASLRANGSVAKLTVVPGKHALFDASCYVADFRGTGASSFMCGAANRRETRHATVSAPFAGILTEVVNTYGGSHRIRYVSSAEIPSKDDGGLSPALPVVASIDLIDDAATIRTDRYSYAGVIKNRRDAFVAFAETRVETLDGAGNPVTTTVERRLRRQGDDKEDILTGLVVSRDVLAPAGCKLRMEQWDHGLAPVTGTQGRYAYVSRTRVFEPSSVDDCSKQRLVRNTVTYPSEYGLPSMKFAQQSLDGHSEDAITRYEYLPPANPGFEPKLHVASVLGGNIACDPSPDSSCRPTPDQLATAPLRELDRRVFEYGEAFDGPCARVAGPWDEAYPSSVVAGHRKQRYVYGVQGRTQCASNIEGAWDVHEWDEQGIVVIAHTTPNGVRSEHHISGIGAPLTEPRGSVANIVDRPGVSTQFAYDALGRIRRVTQSQGMSIDVEVDEADGSHRRELRANRPDGVRIKQRWDGFGRIVEHTESSDTGTRTITYAYDYAGRLARTTLPSPSDPASTVTWSQERDALGRVTRLCGPLGYCEEARHSAFAVDLHGPTDRQERMLLNAFGGVAALWSGNPLALRTKAMFDGSGALREAWDDSGRILSVERMYGSVTKVSRPGVPDTTLRYDASGAISSISQGPRTAELEYDGIGRLVRVHQRPGAKSSTQVQYDYSNSGADIGLLRSVKTPGVRESYRYDDQMRLASVRQSVGRFRGTLELGYEYDALGRLSRVRSGGNAGIQYHYKDGELSAATRIDDPTRPLFEARAFHPVVGPRRVVVGTTDLTRTFDDLGRLASNTLGAHSVAYGYDLSGNVTSLGLGDLKLALEYDDLGRMTHILGGDVDRRYAFNQVDSPTRVADTQLAYENPATPHFATSAAAAPIIRDDYGRITGWGNVGLRYEAGDDVPSRVVLPGWFNDLKVTRGASGDLVRVKRGWRTLYRALGGLECRGRACFFAVVPGPGIRLEVPAEGQKPNVSITDPGHAATVTSNGQGTVSSAIRDGYGVPLSSDRSAHVGNPVVSNGVLLNSKPALSLIGDRVLWGELGSFVSPDDLVPNDLRQGPFNGFTFARNNGYRFTDVGGRYGYDTSGISGGMSFRLNFPLPLFNFGFDLDHGLQSDLDSRVLQGQWADLNATLFRLYAKDQAGFMAKGGTPATLAFPVGLSGQDASGVPRGASIGASYIQSNADAAGSSWLPQYTFFDKVRPKGAWDYKSRVPSMISSPGEWLVAQNAGNFNYGAVGVAVGFSPTTLLQFAGAVQTAQSLKEARRQYLVELLMGRYGVPFDTPPYGDDPIDQYWINRGIEYFQNHGTHQGPM